MKRRIAIALMIWLGALGSAEAGDLSQSPDQRFTVTAVQHSDDFKSGLDNWFTESESGGSVVANDGVMDVDVPAGCTVWFKQKLEGRVMIQYEATAISAGGANDRVSDLNCFWMANDPRSTPDLLAHPRNGKFADYNQLLTYYVGQGGNSNSTTRFRRYIGDKENRPLRAQDDLKDQPHLLVANRKQTIRLVACDKLIQYWHDDEKVFELNDDHPYTSGWFGFRTTKSHLRISNFRVYSLEVTSASPSSRPL